VSAPKPEKPLPKWLVKITRQDAARGQLDSAILLWFLGQDRASIHTLAVAAQTLLHNVGKKAGKPSRSIEWVKSQPPSFQKVVRDAQNFFKHASKDPDRVLIYAPFMAETFMIDAITCFHRLYDFLTPMMRSFALRFSLMYPHVLPPPEHLLKGAKVYELARLSRTDFLKEVLSRLSD
jgi:hypothetical protein